MAMRASSGRSSGSADPKASARKKYQSSSRRGGSSLSGCLQVPSKLKCASVRLMTMILLPPCARAEWNQLFHDSSASASLSSTMSITISDLALSVGAVRLPGDARAPVQEHDQLPHVAQRGFQTRPTPAYRGERPPPVGIAENSPPEGVESVGASAQRSPQLAELQQHRLIGDLPPLGFLDYDSSSEQRSLQLDCGVVIIGGAGFKVLRDEEGNQPASELAGHRRQKHVHFLSVQ
ncbi:hypothetical protein EJB05_47045, partial [Eragrostis curvula]